MPTYDSNYTLETKPTASYTITAKGTRPTTTKVEKPYTEPLAILTEDSVEILCENSIVMTVQGTL
jgi:hypothetical protein